MTARNPFYHIAAATVLVALVSSQGAAISSERTHTVTSVSSITFTRHNIADDFGTAVSVYATDVDGDGDVDVLGASYSDDDISWWENDGSENFTEHVIAGNFDGACSVYATDVDGDNDVDVLGAANGPDDITWWENDGSQNFAEHIIAGNFDGAYSVYATDVDGDNDVDVLGAAWMADEITWWENDGSENFAEHVIAGNFDAARSVYATDVDGDSDVDVLGTASGANDVTWWENDGSENFAEHVIAGNFDGAYSVYATDVDGDNDVDVLGAAWRAEDITWWENDGSENFTEHVIAGNFDAARSVYATDVDGDCDVDVLGGAYYGLTWWESGGPPPDTEPPAAVTNLSTTPSTYPGDIILSWTAPGDDGNTGTASLYEIKWDTQPISSESDWTYAFDVDGEPTPLVAGTAQTMTVTMTPGVTLYFAIRAGDEAGNWGGISGFPQVKAPGMLISDINEQLEKNPSAILGQQVTVLVMPVRTTDLTLGAGDWGETVPALKSLHEICKVFFTKQGAAELAAHGGIGGLLIAIKAALIHQTLDNWLQMRAQLVWGIHEGDLGDRTLLIWDPAAPLMNHGVPYVVTGTVSKKTFFDVLALKNDYFYHLKVEHSSDQVIQQPSTTHPHFAIPAGYTYRKWEDIQVDGVTGYGDPICTIGLVTERYPVGGHHYVRIQLMERISGALPVRVPTDAKAPDMGAMALYCGTKRAAGGDDLHPGWLPLSKYLDTTTGDGSVQLLQGYKSQIERHECPSRTFLGIEIGSPADIHVYDPEGNHVGVVYDGSSNVIGVESEIPDVEYFYGVDDAPEFMAIGNPTAGTYTVTIRGTATGTYTQTVRIYDSSGGQTFTSTVVAQPTYVGKEDTTVVDEIPVAPTGLEVDVDNSMVKLDWDDNTESDLAGYNVYRSTQANGVYQKMNDSPLSVSSSTDSSADEYTAYYYYVTAEDTDHNESGHLAPVVSRYLIYLPLVSRNH